MLKVKYSCPKCGLVDREVNVPERTGGMTIETWMARVSEYLSADHDLANPSCHVETLKDVKIPIATGTPVGHQPYH